MKLDLERIVAALNSLPRDKRPYSVRDMSARDLMSDLGPFIHAEMERAVAEAQDAIKAEREACAAIADKRGEAHGGCGCGAAENIADEIRARA